jgi:hypothetical protein
MERSIDSPHIAHLESMKKIFSKPSRIFMLPAKVDTLALP